MGWLVGGGAASSLHSTSALPTPRLPECRPGQAASPEECPRVHREIGGGSGPGQCGPGLRPAAEAPRAGEPPRPRDPIVFPTVFPTASQPLGGAERQGLTFWLSGRWTPRTRAGLPCRWLPTWARWSWCSCCCGHGRVQTCQTRRATPHCTMPPWGEVRGRGGGPIGPAGGHRTTPTSLPSGTSLRLPGCS